jgi:hypothetical protein
MRPRRLVVLPSLALLAGAALAGDLTLRQRTTTTGGGRSLAREETQYAHGDLLVIDAPDTRTIVDVGANTMTVADKQAKTYFVMTFDDMRRQADAVQARANEMPPDVKKMLDEMLGTGATVTVERTGKRDTIAGHVANEYTLSAGPFRGSIWTTDAITLPEGVRKWRELSASATAPAGPARPLAQALAQVKGVPLRTGMAATLGRGGSITTATEVLEVRTTEAPADVLRIPPGFTKASPPPFE